MGWRRSAGPAALFIVALTLAMSAAAHADPTPPPKLSPSEGRTGATSQPGSPGGAGGGAAIPTVPGGGSIQLFDPSQLPPPTPEARSFIENALSAVRQWGSGLLGDPLLLSALGILVCAGAISALWGGLAALGAFLLAHLKAVGITAGLGAMVCAAGTLFDVVVAGNGDLWRVAGEALRCGLIAGLSAAAFASLAFALPLAVAKVPSVQILATIAQSLKGIAETLTHTVDIKSLLDRIWVYRSVIPGLRDLVEYLQRPVQTTAGVTSAGAAAATSASAALRIPPGAPRPAAGATYIVQPGDSLSRIAQQVYGNGAHWPTIYEANKAAIGPNPGMIRAGQHLVLPSTSKLAQPASVPAPLPAALVAPTAPKPSGGTYVVQPGDSLSKIAQTHFGSSGRWPEIYEANRGIIGTDPNLIRPGQRLVLPSAAAARTPTPAAPPPAPVPAPAPPPAVKSAPPASPAPSTPPVRTYVVQPGDSLSKIAAKIYGNGRRWPEIYGANRSLIGPNANLIRPGQRLVIP